MSKTFRLPREEPLLNIVSYGSSALHENGPRLTPGQVGQIRRTVARVPEVMVKVLPRASHDLEAAGKHLDYISRHGALPLEMDGGQDLEGRKGRAVLDEWDLDIDDLRRQASLAAVNGRKPPRLVHKLMFSMPAGTRPDKVLAAVRNFARAEFWGQHRYALVLHTDEDHPHVHLVLKAVSEQGVRLNIKKATLRHWRSEFARNLRSLGVPANATDRAVRGESGKSLKDGIYRAALRGQSTYLRTRAEAIASAMLKGSLNVERTKSKLIYRRKEIERGWQAMSSILFTQGDHSLATQIRQFVDMMPPARNATDRLADDLRSCAHRSRLNEREALP